MTRGVAILLVPSGFVVKVLLLPPLFRGNPLGVDELRLFVNDACDSRFRLALRKQKFDRTLLSNRDSEINREDGTKIHSNRHTIGL